MDIVERLRNCGNLGLAIEAAQEIERLREALKEILTHEYDYDPCDCIDIARAALKETE